MLYIKEKSFLEGLITAEKESDPHRRIGDSEKIYCYDLLPDPFSTCRRTAIFNVSGIPKEYFGMTGP